MTDTPGQEWSRAAWRTHLPDVDDPAAYLASLGDATLPELAERSARAFPDRLAVRIDEDSITHGRLHAEVACIAGWLSTRIDPGERVLLAGPSGVDFLRCYLGTLRAGGVAVLANPAYTAAELGQLVSDSDAVLAFAGAESAARLDELADPPAIVRFGQLDEQLRHAPLDPPELGPDDVALLAYTSGTTGRPKGVPLTHRQLLSSIRAAMAAWRWSPDDVLVHALPLFHQHGLGGVHATLIAGSSARLLSRFDPAALADAAREASVLFAVPTMYERLVEFPPSTFAGLRLCVCGSAPLSEVLAERVAAVFGRLPLVRYGTTETGLDVSNPHGAARGDTVGLPLPGVLVRIGDDEPSGVDGEIQLRGPQVFDGYWNNPDATAEAFTADGWFRTGDIGRVDPDTGHLSIRGRSKELIITGGMNVYPREVELALEKHPDVAEVAVAGVPHEHWGEQVTAWVVPRGAGVDEAALIEHARTLLAPYKCPKRVYPLDALPRNDMGKIARSRLAPPSAEVAPSAEPSPAEVAVRALRAAPLGDPAYDDPPGGQSRELPGPRPRLSVQDALRASGSVPGAFVEVIGDGPQDGIPVAVKDNIDIAGHTLRSGTPGLAHRQAPSDSHAWARLRSAGCVLIGRTRLSELAWSVHTPDCPNPWDGTRSPGGSSGGSAVAVASGAAALALGTDTGGSVRIPAALCGVAGLRPTAGTVSRRGVTPLAPSMDTVETIAPSAGECLRAHALLGGEVRPAPSTVAGLRVGWPVSLWTNRVDPEVRRLVEAAAETLRAAGVQLVDVALPLARHARVAGYVTMLAESAALWWDACQADPSGLGPGTTALLRAGAGVSTSDYVRARRLAAALRAELDAVLSGCAALLLPTVPVTAAPADAAEVRLDGRSEPIESAYYRLTVLASVTGHPALSVPAGLSSGGLPVGAQLIGARCDESLLCLLGGVIENGGESRALARARVERIARR